MRKVVCIFHTDKGSKGCFSDQQTMDGEVGPDMSHQCFCFIYHGETLILPYDVHTLSPHYSRHFYFVTSLRKSLLLLRCSIHNGKVVKRSLVSIIVAM